MASGKGDIIQVVPDEIYEATKGSSVVNVTGLEEDKPEEGTNTKHTPQTEEHSAPVKHETDSVKSFVSDEGGRNASLKDKFKEKLEVVGDKLRPKEAVEAKNADPHPAIG